MERFVEEITVKNNHSHYSQENLFLCITSPYGDVDGNPDTNAEDLHRVCIAAKRKPNQKESVTWLEQSELKELITSLQIHIKETDGPEATV